LDFCFSIDNTLSAVCISHTSIDYQLNNLPPFAMWLAFPASDYYGGSVAVPDIQRHLPRFSHLGFIT